MRLSPPAPPLRVLPLVVVVAAGCATAPEPPPADLVLWRGTIATVDPDLGRVEALAVRGDRIAAVGSDAEIGAWIGPGTRVVDLAGRLAIPGFIEGHGHFAALGDSLRNLSLGDARSWDEVVARVAEEARRARTGEWVVGRGWHQEKWDDRPEGAVEGFPTHAALSAVSPENPVALRHASGHASIFNARAMELAGVDAATPDPAGGEVLRDAEGRPTGVFRETAERLVGRVREEAEARRSPEEREADLREALRLADEECLRKGVTSFQDAGSSFETLAVVRRMAEEGALGTRIWAMVRDSNERLARHLAAARVVGAADGRFTLRAIKRTLDGALGSRGAWLLEPYADAPESTGLATSTLGSVAETARLAVQHDYQLCVHAIGDRANREVLDLYEGVLGERGRLGDDHRWRVEHAQHLHPDDVPRFASLGVVASMQAVHCTSDGPWVPARLGAERARAGAYLWRSLLDAGVCVTNGTDTPVEDVDPIASFDAAVSRRLPDGSRFHAEQRMTREEALASYTLSCARAAFEEHEKGSLVPGKLADVVVLSADVLRVPEEEIRAAVVDLTLVGGQVLFERPR